MSFPFNKQTASQSARSLRKPLTSQTRRFFFWISLFIAAGMSCNGPKDQNADSGSKLPLISTSAELTTATAGAGAMMVVLDLYADWCGPCRLLSPTLAELAAEYKDKAVFYRINVDKSPELARSFGVRGIPYVVFMKNGTAVYAITGLSPKENYGKVLSLCSGTASVDECLNLLNEKLE